MSRLLTESRNPFVLIGAVTQAATIAITFPVWQVRESPPNLPVWRDQTWQMLGIDPPTFHFGWPLLATLAITILWPARGAIIHLAVLCVAMMFDQFRLQPQFLCTALLMLFVSRNQLHDYGRWLLVALWFWAGLHKWLSAEWFGFIAESLLVQITWFPLNHQLTFACAVAGIEIVLGVVAVFKPSIAAILGPALHLSIVAFLSPLGISKNISVVPWNLYTACVAAKLFYQSEPLILIPFRHAPGNSIRKLIRKPIAAAVLLLTPIGFYTGQNDRTLSFVLYSGNLPQAMVTHFDPLRSQNDTSNRVSFEKVDGWGNLAVPFPHNHKSLIRYFEKTASIGSKFHIQDPRPRVPDRFFVLAETGAKEIDVETFLMPQDGSPPGNPLDNRLAIEALNAIGCRLLRRDPASAIYAVQFAPEKFQPEATRWLTGLLAVEQVQFENCPVTDNDLDPLRELPVLSGLGLSHTKVTDAGVETLAELPYLQTLQTDGTAITPETLRKLGLPSLEP